MSRDPDVGAVPKITRVKGPMGAGRVSPLTTPPRTYVVGEGGDGPDGLWTA